MKVLEAGPDCVKVQFQFGIPTVPGASAELVYTVEAQGALRVDAVYHGVAGAPELPCFGVKFGNLWPGDPHGVDRAFRRNLPGPL